MSKQEISKAVMDWRINWGKPGAPVAIPHNQHWALVDIIASILQHETERAKIVENNLKVANNSLANLQRDFDVLGKEWKCLRDELAKEKERADEAEKEVVRLKTAWSMTHGEMPEILRDMIEDHEWDNKNISEQRDWAVEQLACLKAEPVAKGK